MLATGGGWAVGRARSWRDTPGMGGEGVGDTLVHGVVEAGLAGVIQEDLHAVVEVGEEGRGEDSLARKTVLCQGWYS